MDDRPRLPRPPAPAAHRRRAGGHPGAAAVDEAWALHRAHIHAGRVLVLEGLDPCTVVPVPTDREMREALDHEAEWLLAHPEHPASQWGRTHVPHLRESIEAALRTCTAAAEPGDGEVLRAACPAVTALLATPDGAGP